MPSSHTLLEGRVDGVPDLEHCHLGLPLHNLRHCLQDPLLLLAEAWRGWGMRHSRLLSCSEVCCPHYQPPNPGEGSRSQGVRVNSDNLGGHVKIEYCGFWCWVLTKSSAFKCHFRPRLGSSEGLLNGPLGLQSPYQLNMRPKLSQSIFFPTRFWPESTFSPAKSPRGGSISPK